VSGLGEHNRKDDRADHRSDHGGRERCPYDRHATNAAERLSTAAIICETVGLVQLDRSTLTPGLVEYLFKRAAANDGWR
jgi:hypothetical protein